MDKKIIGLVGLLFAFAFSTSALAVAASDLPEKKRTEANLYMTAKEAAAYLEKNGNRTLFLDVRTAAEVNFLGMPTIADANVPYMVMSEFNTWNPKKKSLKLEVNSNFADEVADRLAKKGLGKDDTIILMCRSGSRSAKAVNLLTKLGYEHVYTMVDGYEGDKAKSGPNAGQRVVNGWKISGLPWSYSLKKAKMYLKK